MKIPPFLVVVTLVSVCSIAILSGILWRCSSVELQYLLPITGPAAEVGKPLLVAILFGITLLPLFVGFWFKRSRRRVSLNLWSWPFIYYFVVFAFIWLFGPVRFGVNPGFILGLVLLAVTVGMARREWIGIFSRAAWRAQWKHLTIDFMVILFLLAIGHLSGESLEWRRVLPALATYPFYALLQLTVFMLISISACSSLSLSSTVRSGICAFLFALAHWPNPTVMAATALGMYYWTWNYLKGRGLAVSALIFGITATVFTQGLPGSWTEEMIVGPGLVRNRALVVLSDWPDPEPHSTDRRGPDFRSFLSHVYPQVLERGASEQELNRWSERLRSAFCSARGYYLFTSAEYCRISNRFDLDPPPPKGVHWVDAPESWRGRIKKIGSEDYWISSGANLAGFYEVLFLDVLRRPFPPERIVGISMNMNRGQRRRIVEVLLDNRSEWSDSPFHGISDEELRYPN